MEDADEHEPKKLRKTQLFPSNKVARMQGLALTVAFNIFSSKRGLFKVLMDVWHKYVYNSMQDIWLYPVMQVLWETASFYVVVILSDK